MWLVAFALVVLPSVGFAQAGARIDGLPAEEVRLLRPLAERGAAAAVYYPDAGPGARISVMVPVAAPLAAVRRALLEADRWPEYMPALRAVSLLSRRGRRSAWRFEVSASLLDVTAVTSLTEVGERRVDFGITESDFGVGGARWDLLDDGPGRTLVVVTSWADPSQGHWLLRQTARSSQTATAGMNVAVDLILALSVTRRARDLAGERTAPRPALAAPRADLAPPALGPWTTLLDNPRRLYVYAIDLAPDGNVTQVTVAHQTWGRADVLASRLEDISHYDNHVPGVRRSEAVGEGTRERARVEFALDTPVESARGTLVRRRDEATGAVWLEGESGSLRDARWRWDLHRTPDHGTLLLLTANVTDATPSAVVRAAAAREPYLYAGLTAMRQLLWLRHMLAGIPF